MPTNVYHMVTGPLRRAINDYGAAPENSGAAFCFMPLLQEGVVIYLLNPNTMNLLPLVLDFSDTLIVFNCNEHKKSS